MAVLASVLSDRSRTDDACPNLLLRTQNDTHMTQYNFGIDSTIQLPDESQITQCGVPSGRPLDDVCSAAREVLRDPSDFPPLCRIVVPGDRVAIVLDEGLQQASSIVAAVVLELLDANIDPDAITVLRSETDARLSRANPTRDLPMGIRDQVQVVMHDPYDREKLALLGVSSDDEPIYLTREIVDADVVLPICVVKPTDSLGNLGIYGTLFPNFADDATKQRFNTPRSVLSDSELSRRRQEAKEASWLLGVRLCLQVIPGVGEEILAVLAGDADVVDQLASQQCEQLWHFHVNERASLVVATMTGGRQQQSWSNFARALDSALRVVQDDGAIAICCDIQAKPGPSLKRIANADSLDAADRSIQRDNSFDALPAIQLVRTLQRVRVYMLSQLDEEVVQSLGIAYISCPEEVVRLATRHDSCILLQNAHQAVPLIAAEAL